jgi:hypothetical protein
LGTCLRRDFPVFALQVWSEFLVRYGSSRRFGAPRRSIPCPRFSRKSARNLRGRLWPLLASHTELSLSRHLASAGAIGRSVGDAGEHHLSLAGRILGNVDKGLAEVAA